MGFLFSILAGAAMSLQGVLNTRLSEKIGLYESNLWVQGTAFLLSLPAMLLLGKGNLRGITDVSKVYLLGGVLGLVITVTVMLGIGHLSPALATATILITQLLVSAVIDQFGWLGTPQNSMHWNQFTALGLMIGGVVLFKWQF